MKKDVVLPHKLFQLDLGPSFVLPPMPVVFSQPVRSYRDIAQGGFKPDIEHFVFKAWNRDSYSPLQVAGDASISNLLVQPTPGDPFRIISPAHPLSLNPFFERADLFPQLQIEMSSSPRSRPFFADETLERIKFGFKVVEDGGARLALVSSGFGSALLASSFHEPIG
jgi:hypothetical protein